MNVLIVCPQSLRHLAIHLVAAITGDVSNLGCMQSLTYRKNNVDYAVVSIHSAYVNVAALNASLVRPEQDVLEIINMEKANEATARLSKSIVGSNLISIFSCEPGAEFAILSEKELNKITA